MTTPQFRHLITLSLAAAVLVWAPIVEAQSAADAKRTIRAQRKYYKEPGYIDAEIRYMRGTLLVTGWVGTEALVEQGRGLFDAALHDRDRVGIHVFREVFCEHLGGVRVVPHHKEHVARALATQGLDQWTRQRIGMESLKHGAAERSGAWPMASPGLEPLCVDTSCARSPLC